MLLIDGVSKSYGKKKAIEDISFEVPEGSTFGMLGPNGAGKTTLIRIINRILTPDTGTVRFNGKEIRSDMISQIGYLPEERGLYKKMKVGEQVLYLARLKGLSPTDAKAKLKWWFERMEIGSWWEKKVETLSKGMQQKVQFIATVVHDPKLIILDEPFSGFDPVNAEAVKNELLRLRDEGATIMLSTHRMETVEELCDYMAMIHQSKKALDGKISNIKEAHKEGIFEIKIRGEALDEIPVEFGEMVFSETEGQDQLIRIKIADIEPNELLSYAMQKGQVLSFKELLPTVGDLFVQIAKN